MKNEENREFLFSQEMQGGQGAQPLLPTGQANIASELLLLQQRLAAYEQLHIEEMTELRQEIERLRRAFLQETNSHLRALRLLALRRLHASRAAFAFLAFLSDL